jgi:hypothetical protein
MNNQIQKTEVTTGDLRKFGFIMGGMFALIFGLVFPWLTSRTMENWPIWPFIVLAIFWLLAIIYPEILRPVNSLWIKIGNVLGFINSRIILGIMFFLLIFPIGLILKLFGKDSMNRKFNDKIKTYRKIVKPRNKENLEKPF